VLLSPRFGQPAGHRRVQHRRAVPLQLLPYPIKSCDPHGKIGKAFFHSVCDAFLLRLGWNWNIKGRETLGADVVNTHATACLDEDAGTRQVAEEVQRVSRRQRLRTE
jgi:hypothetical protein